MSKYYKENYEMPFICDDSISNIFEILADGTERIIWESFVPVKGSIIVEYEFDNSIPEPLQVAIERFDQDIIMRTLKVGDLITITSLGLKRVLLTPPDIPENGTIQIDFEFCIQEEVNNHHCDCC